MALNQVPNHLHHAAWLRSPSPSSVSARSGAGVFLGLVNLGQAKPDVIGSVEVGDSKGQPKEVVEVLMFSDEIRSNLHFEHMWVNSGYFSQILPSAGPSLSLGTPAT
jgi:hypothetical protein